MNKSTKPLSKPRISGKEPSKTKVLTAVLETVGPDFAGQRLDNYLLRWAKGVPKSHIYRIIRSGDRKSVV